MKNYRKLFLRFWPLGFLLFIWFVFSAPYFFQQKVPYPSKYQVTFFSPWSYYGEFAGPVKNNAMPDVVDQIYPWKYLTIQTLKSGEIPYWNPYNFAGNPHLANFQTAVFSPFNLLFFVLPFIDAWSMLVLLQALIAGVFMYAFMRELLVSKTGSLISSIAFMFCGFMVVWMAYSTLSLAIAFLPLVLFAVERAFQRREKWSLPLLSIGLACSYFSGHIQTSIYLLLMTALYIVFKVLITRWVRRFFLVLLFFMVGLSIAMLQVLPTKELLDQSVRNDYVYQGGEIPLHYLVTLFAPDFYGNPVTRNDWMGYYAEWASFIGIIPFVLAIFALVKPKPHSWFFFIIGLLALACASDTPLRDLLAISGIPVFATSIPSRMIVLFSFSFAVLSGFGFDVLQKLIKEHAKKRIIAVFGILGLLLSLIWLALMVFHALPLDKTALAQKNLILPTAVFLLTAFVVLVTTFYKPKQGLLLVTILLVALTSIDSLRFAIKWMPFDPRDLVFPEIPVVQEMKKRVGNDRFFGKMGTQVESYYGIASVEGYDPLYNKRYGEFIRSSITGDYLPAERSVVQLPSRGKYTERVLDFLGVSIIFHPRANSFQGWAFPVWDDAKKYVRVYEDDKFELYKNTTALPRAKLFYHYEVIKDEKKLLKRFYTDDFDYRNILLVEEDPKLITNGEKPTTSKTKIISYTPNKVVIAVSTDKPALLFLSDSYYAPWKAKVNGKEEKIFRTDYTFRSVYVPAGKSTVEFFYRGLF